MERHSDVTFGKVNTEEQVELASAVAVRAIPTVMAFKNGVLVFSQPGLLPKSALDKLVEKLRALDVEAVASNRLPIRRQHSDGRADAGPTVEESGPSPRGRAASGRR